MKRSIAPSATAKQAEIENNTFQSIFKCYVFTFRAPPILVMAENTEPPNHECIGVNCPFVVDTGEAYVCTETGICVGELFVVCFDYASSSTRFNVSSTVPSTSFVKNAMAAPLPAKDNDEDDKRSREQLYAECYRVVSKMLHTEGDESMTAHNTKLVDRAMKQANGVSKKRRDGKLRLMPVIFNFVRLMQEGAKPETTEVHAADWKSAVARRCADCCAMCFRLHPNATNAKVKPAYMCLAVLYMIREGVTVKGVKLCVQDARVAKTLPSLNSLSAFGYQKSKYTKAERFLLASLDQALFTRPLHEIRF